MSVTLSEVKRAARAHRAALAGESAGYLVLAIADQLLQAPRLVQAAEVQLTEDGALRLSAGRASSDEDAELSLRRALDQLLLVASSGSAALTRASRRTVPVGLTALVRELEAALIPVNRAAARRALSRLHRETARAVESKQLPDDVEPELAPLPEPAPSSAAPSARLAPRLVAPGPLAPASLAPLGASEAPAHSVSALQPVAEAAEPLVMSPAPEPANPAPPSAAVPIRVEAQQSLPGEALLDVDQELETPALNAPVSAVAAVVDSRFDGVVSALCEQLPAPPQFVESDALTSALAVRPVTAPRAVAEPEPELLLDVDVEFEPDATDAVDSSTAPTVMRAVAVEPVTLRTVADPAESEQPMLDLPSEARTRPEPAVLRKTLRPLLDSLPPPISETVALSDTPTLGSLATQLPILAPEQIAELTAATNFAQAHSEQTLEDFTELMPEVESLAPGVPMVASKKSDVNELVGRFQVAEPDVNPGLCRAIKEMADLDLTPAPFAALIR